MTTRKDFEDEMELNDITAKLVGLNEEEFQKLARDGHVDIPSPTRAAAEGDGAEDAPPAHDFSSSDTE